jgi:hypothetical protein
MEENPYKSSDIVLEQAAKVVRRPFLVWLTQSILGVIILFQAYILGVIAFSLPKILTSSVSNSDLFYAISLSAAQLVLACMLFIGLVKARKWAWYASVLFAIFIMVCVFYSRAHPSPQATPIPPNQLLGAAVAEFVITILIVVYPLRMYFSKKVRAFLVS